MTRRSSVSIARRRCHAEPRPFPRGSPSTTTGRARRRSSLSVQPVSTSTQGRSNACAIRWPTTRSESSRLSPAEQHPRHLGGEVGLAAAALGLLRARAGGAGERRGDRRDDEEHDQRDPVLLVGDREPAGRRDVEEVEGERAEDRGADPQAEAPVARGEQHRQQVERPRRPRPASPRAARRSARSRSPPRSPRPRRPRRSNGLAGSAASRSATRLTSPRTRPLSIRPRLQHGAG